VKENVSMTNGPGGTPGPNRRPHLIVALVVAAMLALLLAACGSSSSSSSETTVETGGSGGGGGAAASSETGKELSALLGTPTGKEAGEGETVKMGAILALSGRERSTAKKACTRSNWRPKKSKPPEGRSWN